MTQRSQEGSHQDRQCGVRVEAAAMSKVGRGGGGWNEGLTACSRGVQLDYRGTSEPEVPGPGHRVRWPEETNSGRDTLE